MKNKKTSMNYLIIKYALLIMSILSIYGIWSDFLPNGEFFGYMQIVSLFVATILTLLFYIEFSKPTSRFRTNIKGKQSPLATAIAIALVLYIVSYISITLAMLALLHEFTASKGQQSFVVKSKSSSYHDRRCTGGITIEHKSFLKDKICGIPQDFWQDISKGDMLILMGKKSQFGLSYDRVKYIKKP